jgi:hypothetical protein
LRCSVIHIAETDNGRKLIPNRFFPGDKKTHQQINSSKRDCDKCGLYDGKRILLEEIGVFGKYAQINDGENDQGNGKPPFHEGF